MKRRLDRWALRCELSATGPGGVRVLVDPINPPEVSIYLWGTYEPEVVAALSAVTGRGATTVDVGANCGVLSLVMASLAAGGRTLAIDPSPQACKRIRQQAKVNGLGIVTITAALGARAARDQYFLTSIGIGVLPPADRALATPTAVPVTIRTLDEVLSEHACGTADVVKIDTDGAEPEVLDGATETLSRSRPALIFEYSVAGMQRRGSSRADLVERLTGHRYEIFAARSAPQSWWRAGPVRPQGFIRAPEAELLAGKYDEQNLVALPAGPEGEAWRESLGVRA